MKTPRFLLGASLLLCAGMIAGCTAKADYSAEFVRYETLRDGTRVAVVSLVGHNHADVSRAYTDISDLKPGELVLVDAYGRSWDTPRWKPDREIVSRAPKR